MEKNTEKKKRAPYKTKAPTRGGARKGAGRPKGSTQQLTVEGLLTTLKDQSNGQNYENLLVQDFLRAREINDTHLVIKYHNLILNKVMNSLTKIEVTDSQDQIEAKQLAFAEALSKLTGVKE